VLIVGTYVFPEVFPALTSPFDSGCRIVHIDLDDFEIAKNFPVDVPLVADPAPTLAALAELLADLVPDNVRYAPDRVAVRPDSTLEVFAAELAAQAGDDLVVFDEALTASPSIVRHLPPRIPGNYFLTRGGSLGVGIPGAVGAKLARPDAHVVGFTGDGGAMYTVQALWTAARYGIDAKFVVCNNHRYALLDSNIERYWQERGVESHEHPTGFDLRGPDLGFVDIARGLGVAAVRVCRPDDAGAAVRRMLSHDGPHLIDLQTA
jgi:benzoylformate decarboxylase